MSERTFEISKSFVRRAIVACQAAGLLLSGCQARRASAWCGEDGEILAANFGFGSGLQPACSDSTHPRTHVVRNHHSRPPPIFSWGHHDTKSTTEELVSRSLARRARGKSRDLARMVQAQKSAKGSAGAGRAAHSKGGGGVGSGKKTAAGGKKVDDERDETLQAVVCCSPIQCEA